MEIGKLNKRIEFGTLGSGTDEDGFPVENVWKVFRGCWASIKGLRGREFYSASAVQAENDKVFNCRYFKGLTTDMQIKYNKSLYDITSINDLYEKHEEYEIHAKLVK